MKLRPIYLFAALFSLAFLSGGNPVAWRKIACVEGVDGLYATSHLALENDLFARVRTQAEEDQLRKGTIDFYNFLTQNELRYHMDLRAAYQGYSIFMPQPFTIGGQFAPLGYSPGLQLTNLWGPSNPLTTYGTGVQAAPGSMAFVPGSSGALPSSYMSSWMGSVPASTSLSPTGGVFTGAQMPAAPAVSAKPVIAPITGQPASGSAAYAPAPRFIN